MKTIKKHFASFKKAANYQSNLYNKYNSVELVDFPRIDPNGCGTYTFKVK